MVSSPSFQTYYRKKEKREAKQFASTNENKRFWIGPLHSSVDQSVRRQIGSLQVGNAAGILVRNCLDCRNCRVTHALTILHRSIQELCFERSRSTRPELPNKLTVPKFCEEVKVSSPQKCRTPLESPDPQDFNKHCFKMGHPCQFRENIVPRYQIQFLCIIPKGVNFHYNVKGLSQNQFEMFLQLQECYNTPIYSAMGFS